MNTHNLRCTGARDTVRWFDTSSPINDWFNKSAWCTENVEAPLKSTTGAACVSIPTILVYQQYLRFSINSRMCTSHIKDQRLNTMWCSTLGASKVHVKVKLCTLFCNVTLKRKKKWHRYKQSINVRIYKKAGGWPSNHGSGEYGCPIWPRKQWSGKVTWLHQSDNTPYQMADNCTTYLKDRVVRLQSGCLVPSRQHDGLDHQTSPSAHHTSDRPRNARSACHDMQN